MTASSHAFSCLAKVQELVLPGRTFAKVAPRSGVYKHSKPPG